MMENINKNGIPCSASICTYSAVKNYSNNHYPLLQLFPTLYHDDLYVCSNHNHLHLCRSFSPECEIDTVDANSIGKCKFTGKRNKYFTNSRCDYRKNIAETDRKWRFHGKHGIALKHLIETGGNIEEYSIPNPYVYHMIIVEDIEKAGITVNDDKLASAISRTYEYFLSNSTPSSWEEHLQIIRASFLELFSKSAITSTAYGSSDFKTGIKFIISMDMIGRVKPALSLYAPEKYIKKRELKLQAMRNNAKKVKRNLRR